MNELKNWREVTKGMYRYVIGSNACYEIHLLTWYHHTDILSANANAYIVGDWNMNGPVFERELLLTGPVSACIVEVIEDYEKNITE